MDAPALDPEPFQCGPVTRAIAYLERNRNVDGFRQLDRLEAARAMRLVNASPPPTHYAYSLVILARLHGGKTIVLMGNDAEICRAVVIAKDSSAEFIAAVSGDRT